MFQLNDGSAGKTRSYSREKKISGMQDQCDTEGSRRPAFYIRHCRIRPMKGNGTFNEDLLRLVVDQNSIFAIFMPCWKG